MKIHYINILLFALPLNILLLSSQVYNQRNHKSTIPHNTPKIPTNRSLCECELYAPSNYHNDPQMKELLENFDKQTSQRFEEYEERMKTTRQKCKDQCDKDVQKIILKDKIEKELMDKFATLQTDIQSDGIPTCVCEKSVAHKMEKFCLNCGVDVGGGVTLSSGVLGGIGAVSVHAWKHLALEAAIDFATEAGAAVGEAAGNAQGMKIVIYYLKDYWGVDELIPEIYKTFVATNRYADVTTITGAIVKEHAQNCAHSLLNNPAMCKKISIQFGLMDAATLRPSGSPPAQAIPQMIKGLAEEATQGAAEVAKKASESATAAITKKQTALIEAGFNNSITSIYASIIAILIIVLIMVIIYLILRYRRKKKMKKKLQYIKLLEE